MPEERTTGGRDQYGKFLRDDVHCTDCQMLSINGMPSHENGCRSAWQREVRRCRDCGCDFRPIERDVAICEDCWNTLQENE